MAALDAADEVPRPAAVAHHALGFAAAFGGFVAFLIVLVLGAAGWAVGRWLDGQLDLSAFTRRRPDTTDRGWQ